MGRPPLWWHRCRDPRRSIPDDSLTVWQWNRCDRDPAEEDLIEERVERGIEIAQGEASTEGPEEVCVLAHAVLDDVAAPAAALLREHVDGGGDVGVADGLMSEDDATASFADVDSEVRIVAWSWIMAADRANGCGTEGTEGARDDREDAQPRLGLSAERDRHAILQGLDFGQQVLVAVTHSKHASHGIDPGVQQWAQELTHGLSIEGRVGIHEDNGLGLDEAQASIEGR